MVCVYPHTHISHMYTQALEQKRQVAQFLEAAQSLVAQQVSSVEGIGRARRDAKELINQLPGILSMRCEMRGVMCRVGYA